MRIKNKVIIITTLVLISTSSFAQYNNSISSYTQYINIALSLGTNSLGGTARYIGTGGAVSSIGSDISNLSTNPAGIGMFSMSEFSFTPSFQINEVSSDFVYLNGGNIAGSINSSENAYRFVINNLGIVIANRSPEGSGKLLSSSNIAIAINRTHNFNQRFNFYNQNSGYTFSESAARDLTLAYRKNPSNFPKTFFPTVDSYYDYRTREMALYDGGGVGFTDDSTLSSPAGIVDQSGYSHVKGGVNELSIAWAGSFKDKTYLGISMGIPIYNQTITKFYEESDVDFTGGSSLRGQFVSLDFIEEEKNSGAGVNLKLGVLHKLNDEIRVSGYFHTPTYMSISQDYSVTSQSRYDLDPQPRTRGIEINDFQFDMITPMKLGLGLGALIAKKGFISAEYEWATVGGSSFLLEDVKDKININNKIKANFKAIHTFRLGGEYAYKNLRLRAGLNYRTSPYETNKIIIDGSDESSLTLAGGVGFRGKKYSIDIAYQRTTFNQYFSFYTDESNGEYGYDNSVTNGQISTTLNIRFSGKGKRRGN